MKTRVVFETCFRMNQLQRLKTRVNQRFLSNILQEPTLLFYRLFHHNFCRITYMKRPKYLRMYPTLLVYPDGSTLTVRHPEPRAIIKLPLLFEDCKTDQERAAWTMRRKPVEKVTIKDDRSEVKFDPKKYINMVKRS